MARIFRARFVVYVMSVLCIHAGSFLSEVGAACGSGEETARYRLEFQGLWGERSFPKSYPKYRMNAQWSTLTGASHNDRFTMWEEGQLASQFFKSFAEGEDSTGKRLQSKMVRDPAVHNVFAAKSTTAGTESTSTIAFLHRDFTKISFATHLFPSPDWFVGVSGIDLCEGGTWRKESLSLELQPWDAGTDGGFAFTSPDYVSTPQESITKITSQYPNHPANSFFYPKLDSLPPIARITFQWMDERCPTGLEAVFRGKDRQGGDGRRGSENSNDGCKPRNSPEVVFPGMDVASSSEAGRGGQVIPYDCEVTEWGSWSPCDKFCKVGIRRRFRLVIQPPKNGGSDCPALIGLEACRRAGTSHTRPQTRCLKSRMKKETKKYMKVQRRNYMGEKKRNRFIV